MKSLIPHTPVVFPLKSHFIHLCNALLERARTEHMRSLRHLLTSEKPIADVSIFEPSTTLDRPQVSRRGNDDAVASRS